MNAPTRIRYLVVSVTFLVAVLLYLHRYCLNFTQQLVKQDLQLTDDQLGYCFTAFFVAYALGQVPSGWLSDRFGARITLPLYILVWSVFTSITGLVGGLTMLLVTRVAVGLGQAGAYPSAAGIVRRWVPFPVRGTANSVVAFGGRMGGFLAPIVTAAVVVLMVPGDVSPMPVVEDLLSPDKMRDRLFNEPDEDEKGYDKLRNDIARELGQEFVHTEPTTVALLDWLHELIANGDLASKLKSRWETLPIDREARQQLERGDLSDADTQRLNRLLLEAVFPDSLRKLYVHGWRQTMILFGAIGLFVAVIFVFLHRSAPTDHPLCNQAERELIAGVDPGKEIPKPVVRGVPLRAILASRCLWLMCLNQWCGNIAWTFLVTWLPAYLVEVHSVPFVERNWLVSIPLGTGWLGMLCGGVATDLAVRKWGLRWRTGPIVAGRFAAMAAYLGFLVNPSLSTAAICLAVVGFMNDFCNPSSWAYKQDVGGPHTASIHGWANMWGNLGAAASPMLLLAVKTHFGWNAVFAVCAAAFAISGLAALGVDARIPVVTDDAESL